MCKGELKQQSFSLSTPLNFFKHLLQRWGSPFWADTAPPCSKSRHFHANFFQLSAAFPRWVRFFPPEDSGWCLGWEGHTSPVSSISLGHRDFRFWGSFSLGCVFYWSRNMITKLGMKLYGLKFLTQLCHYCSVNYFILNPLGENKAELNALAQCQAACWGFRTSNLGSEAKEFH